MICKNCKREIPDNSIFCNWCGERQIAERRPKDEIKVPKPRQLPSGKWTIYLRAEGQSVTETTPEAAATKAKAIRAGFLQAQKKHTGIRLGQAYDAYLSSRKSVLSPSTYAGYSRLRKNTFRSLMQLDVARIDSDLVQKEISEMARSGKSPKYIYNAYSLLSVVLQSQSPPVSLEVRLPQWQRTVTRELSDDEIGQILQAVQGTEIELPTLMGLWLGMRMSEICGLKYEDIDGSALHICRALVIDQDGRAQEKLPKTASGDRWLTCPPYIMELIRAQGENDGFVVRLSGQAIYKRFARLLKKNGIRHCRFHDLRHANAAVMVRIGIESRYAQARNGWASDQMYKQVYAYIMDDKMAEVEQKINAYFADKITYE